MIYLLLILSCIEDISVKQINECIDICKSNEGLSKVVVNAGSQTPMRCHCENKVVFYPEKF